MLFSKGRKQRREMESYLRRVSDMTNPNGGSSEGNVRAENRFSRIFPVLIAPWENDVPLLTNCTYGLTKDLSEHGIAVVITRPFKQKNVVIGIWPTNELITAGSSKPGFMLGEVRAEFEIGAAFYQLGIQLQEMIDDSHPQFDKLRTQVKCLLPPDQLKLLKASVATASR